MSRNAYTWAGILILLLLTVSCESRADFPATQGTSAPSSATYQTRNGGTAGSLSAACAANTTHFNNQACSQGQGCGYTTLVCQHISNSAYQWRAQMEGVGISALENHGYSVTCPGGTTWNSTSGVCVSSSYSCPANATLSGTTCTCNSGFTQQGSGSGATCIAACPSAGTTASGWMPANQNPALVCAGGCTLSVVSASNQFAVGGNQVIAGTWQYTGGNVGDCTGNPNMSTGSIPQNNQAPSCPTGQCIGQVNGQWTCLACSSSNPATSYNTQQTTTTDPNNQTTTQTTSTTTTNAGPGQVSTTQSTTTQVGGNAPTTTTKTTKGDGDGDTGDTDQAQYCRDNPDAPQCKKSSFSGSCTAAFSCDGDAITCAIAKEQHTRNCALFVTETTLSTLGNQVAAGTDPLDAQMPWKAANIVNQDLSNAIDSSTWLSSSGAADKTVQVGAYSFVIPFSKWNQVLQIMGAIVLAFSFIAAARIVSGTVKG